MARDSKRRRLWRAQLGHMWQAAGCPWPLYAGDISQPHVRRSHLSTALSTRGARVAALIRAIYRADGF